MAWYYKERLIRVGRGWTDDNGIKHPTNWVSWNINDKTKAGLNWVPDENIVPYDDRFYWSADIPKSLADQTKDGVTSPGLKTNAIAKVKQQAKSLLEPTDWMIVRAAETGKQPSDEVTAYRQAVRDAADIMEAAIKQCVNLAEFKQLHISTNDTEGNIVEKAVLDSWPESL